MFVKFLKLKCKYTKKYEIHFVFVSLAVMSETRIFALRKLITTAKNLAIVMHVNPDGDAMGSALALYEYAKNQDIETTVISPGVISNTLKWLPNSEKILEFEEVSQKHLKRLQEFDTVVFVDHSSTGRCENIPQYLEIERGRRAYIDHHPSPDFEVGIAVSETNSAATCCIVFELLQKWQANITPTIASCLYTGIVTDTGNFRYGKGIAQVFHIASELVKLGIDKEEITQSIYYTNTENRLRLLGFVLQEKMQLVGKHAAYITLTKQEIEKNGAEYSDTEDFVNQPLTIKNVNISAIFIEKEDYIKISFRSRGKFDVNLLARNHFNGGGHKNAAGGRFFGTLQEAVALYSKNVI